MAINHYFDSICRIIVAEMSSLAPKEPDMRSSFLKEITESDIVYRLGKPFGHLAKYRTVGPDIQINELDFQVEVKFFRNWKNKNSRTPAGWKATQKDFDNLFEARAVRGMGSFAIIIAWPGGMTSWSQTAQLGGIREGKKKPGPNPIVVPEKLQYLPFLTFDPAGGTRSIKVSDQESGRSVVQTLQGEPCLNWCRYGTKDDVLNLAMLW